MGGPVRVATLVVTAMDATRMKIHARGAVQGVGFRPTVYRVATGLRLRGFVSNSAFGVEIDVEGEAAAVEAFVPALLANRPRRAVIHGLETRRLDVAGYTTFVVRETEASGTATTLVLPDIAVCDDCLREMNDPRDRRYLYPFINCTNCGPRFTIIQSLPYDRERTTMSRFTMCARCQAEYDDPLDRRFHAQPNACDACGPRLSWRGASGKTMSKGDDALRGAAEALREGRIVAVKGIGGFHLMCDARNEAAVRELRKRKRREEKPFAVMAADLAAGRLLCEVDPAEETLLRSPECPIVLLRRLENSGLATSVAPGNPFLGVVLPYAPLQHLLMGALRFPVVATSGNLSDEPIVTNDDEAVTRLRGIADFFLGHDRPIERYVDDSIARLVRGRPMLLRRARGHAPLPLAHVVGARSILAVGAHLKSTIGFAVDGHLMLSHHLGDLETAEALAGFETAISDLPGLYAFQAEIVAHDLHPDYASSRFAESASGTSLGVQHHVAHALACMADNELTGDVLAVVWDGAGLGTDGTIWGGEFFRMRDTAFERVAHLRTFPLAGGDAAAREPRRSALGLLYEARGSALFDDDGLRDRLGFTEAEWSLLAGMLKSGASVARTSSVGRLFDGVAALAGLRRRSGFEGQAAMELEFAAAGRGSESPYAFTLKGAVLDWAPMLEAIDAECNGVQAVPVIARRFHDTLAAMILAVARREGLERVCLTGGCFQNLRLAETTIERLGALGFKPYWHQRVPPNDGGIALGQLVAAAHHQR